MGNEKIHTTSHQPSPTTALQRIQKTGALKHRRVSLAPGALKHRKTSKNLRLHRPRRKAFSPQSQGVLERAAKARLVSENVWARVGCGQE